MCVQEARNAILALGRAGVPDLPWLHGADLLKGGDHSRVLLLGRLRALFSFSFFLSDFFPLSLLSSFFLSLAGLTCQAILRLTFWVSGADSSTVAQKKSGLLRYSRGCMGRTGHGRVPCDVTITQNIVEPIPTLGALFPRGRPVQVPVLTCELSGDLQ